MASVEVSKLSNQEVAELACTYAALILHDEDQLPTSITSTIKHIKSVVAYDILGRKLQTYNNLNTKNLEEPFIGSERFIIGIAFQ